jgi:hypothetical protein
MKLIPHEIILVDSIPACNFCKDGTPGPYDFATRMGPWANGCKQHWELYRAAPTLGTGKGQLWITEDQVTKEDEHVVTFGTLHPDGTVTDERGIKQSAIMACPHLIIAAEHYREDGSCRCDDPDHSLMVEWEYSWDAETRRWT